jgi:hypothetical protein
LSFAELSSSFAVFAAPQATTTTSAVYRSLSPLCPTTTSVTAVPAGFVSSFSACAFVNSVTLECSSAGRTPISSASDFACTAQGNPSQLMQRTQRLYGMFCSLSLIPFGEWNGW